MADTILIRPTTPEDIPALMTLYAAAFPDEDLRPLVTALLTGDAEVLSLTAVDGAGEPTRGGDSAGMAAETTETAEIMAGHVAFTLFDGAGADDARAGALLGPLAVAPDRWRRGIGSALVREGLAQATARGARQAFVLGDPAYYSRFGFQPEHAVQPPYPLPYEWIGAWRSLTLSDRAPLSPPSVESAESAGSAGSARWPNVWMNPALWGG